MGVPVDDVETNWHPAPPHSWVSRPDAEIVAGGLRFLVEWKSNGTAAAVTMAIRTVRQFLENSSEQFISLVAAPYMGPIGRRLCEEAQVNWLDLSGNAHLVAPGLRVIVEGRENQYKRPGRPRNLFAPKSSRIARYLLQHPDKPVSQSELASSTGMDAGFTSRIVRELTRERLVTRTSDRRLRLADYNALLDGWREAYAFSGHEILRGHIAARSGEELLARLSDGMNRSTQPYAVTGLAAAWLLTRFASFRLVTAFVADRPAPQWLDEIGFRDETRGENVWLVVPNDEGVFHGATQRDGVRCVHPVQAYLDLQEHPERSAEAAAELRKRLLSGKHQGE